MRVQIKCFCACSYVYIIEYCVSEYISVLSVVSVKVCTSSNRYTVLFTVYYTCLYVHVQYIMA